MAWVAAVALSDENVVAFAKRDLLSIHRPCSRVGFKSSQAARRTTKYGNVPEGAIERSAARGVHQEIGAIRRNIENVGKAGVLERIGHGKRIATGHGSLR